MFWMLILTLSFGTPEQRELIIRSGIATWDDCVKLAIAELHAHPPPVATRCEPYREI